MKTLIFIVAIIASTILSTPKTLGTKLHYIKYRSNFSGDSVRSKDPLYAVLSAYIALKNALTTDDGKTAQTSAKMLLAEIEKVKMDGMTTDQHSAWMKYMKKLSFDAEHISKTDDTEHQREHFVTLSKNIYAVEKAFNTNAVTLYYQFCPMANDGKGASWLSEKEKISNPYMGKKMPTCGSIKETINVK
jgi:hypothetical protein